MGGRNGRSQMLRPQKRPTQNPRGKDQTESRHRKPVRTEDSTKKQDGKGSFVRTLFQGYGKGSNVQESIPSVAKPPETKKDVVVVEVSLEKDPTTGHMRPVGLPPMIRNYSQGREW